MNNLRCFSAALLAVCSMSAYGQVNDNMCGLVGFANYRDLGLYGTTGGGQGEVVRVSTREQLEQYAKGSSPCVIIIENDITGKGNIGEGAAGVKDYISLGSNKTIIGGGNGVTLNKLGFDANGQQNIIIRNLKITNCNPDALAFRNTHHVWVDHCDLSSCADGLLDFTIGSSYLSVSWTKFSNHDKVSICNSGTNHFEDHGKERATYHHCWFDNTTHRLWVGTCVQQLLYQQQFLLRGLSYKGESRCGELFLQEYPQSAKPDVQRRPCDCQLCRCLEQRQQIRERIRKYQ